MTKTMLSNEHIDYILWDLEARGLTDLSLQEELLDHICCVVEEKMAVGGLFVTAYKEAVEAFGPNGFETIQRHTQTSIHQKPLNMLKATLLTSLMIIGFMASFALFQQPVTMGTTPDIWASPMGEKTEVTSGFGMRMNPVLKKRMMHKGVDFRAPLGTEIYAARDGVIQAAGVPPKGKEGYGITIGIDHDSSFQTFYAHLSEVKVEVGQQVKAGELIALSGNSGLSKGPHLHFEVIKDGFNINPNTYPVLVTKQVEEH
jgi:murein DD-endopeptidase MepM/ murein hydrolase activator NlpD